VNLTTPSQRERNERRDQQRRERYITARRVAAARLERDAAVAAAQADADPGLDTPVVDAGGGGGGSSSSSAPPPLPLPPPNSAGDILRRGPATVHSALVGSGAALRAGDRWVDYRTPLRSTIADAGTNLLKADWVRIVERALENDRNTSFAPGAILSATSRGRLTVVQLKALAQVLGADLLGLVPRAGEDNDGNNSVVGESSRSAILARALERELRAREKRRTEE
jgi:hypothetical protein